MKLASRCFRWCSLHVFVLIAFASCFASAQDVIEWKVRTHPDYVEDAEYIPLEEDIGTFLEREITQPLIRWEELLQLGYEILPNKYFYEYTPPISTKALHRKFRKLEAEADKLLEGLE